LAAGELAAQSFPGEQLDRFDKRSAVSSFSPREPGKWALCLIDGHINGTFVRVDLAPRKIEMLTEKGVYMGRVADQRSAREPRPPRRGDRDRAFLSARHQIGRNQN
jgi:hypothetical protein